MRTPSLRLILFYFGGVLCANVWSLGGRQGKQTHSHSHTHLRNLDFPVHLSCTSFEGELLVDAAARKAFTGGYNGSKFHPPLSKLCVCETDSCLFYNFLFCFKHNLFILKNLHVSSKHNIFISLRFSNSLHHDPHKHALYPEQRRRVTDCKPLVFPAQMVFTLCSVATTAAILIGCNSFFLTPATDGGCQENSNRHTGKRFLVSRLPRNYCFFSFF